jgi:hypothetical protein
MCGAKMCACARAGSDGRNSWELLESSLQGIRPDEVLADPDARDFTFVDEHQCIGITPPPPSPPAAAAALSLPPSLPPSLSPSLPLTLPPSLSPNPNPEPRTLFQAATTVR